MITRNILRLCCILLIVSACNKADFLNAKPDASLVVPETLSELQAVLDNDKVMNGQGSAGMDGPISALGEAGADDFYLTENRYDHDLQEDLIHRRAYTWEKDIYKGSQALDYPAAYKAIFYANVALDGLEKLTVPAEDIRKYENIKGSALFYRSHMFYQLAQLYAPVYDALTADKELGIILKLKSDINELRKRATLQATYNQIIIDLESAISFLPNTAKYKTRPCKAAAYGLLARVYLSMREYEKAFINANECLMLNSALLDYNSIYPASNVYPMPKSSENPEVLFHCLLKYPPTINFNSLIDSTLYSSYEANDLRKELFYRPSFTNPTGMMFIGTYEPVGFLWGGIGVDEIYLIRAECYARKDNFLLAMTDLNMLLKYRFDSSFTPRTATDPVDALNQILVERRKELPFRGLRWTDLRRLNKEGANIALKRIIHDQIFTLDPNSPLYVYPFPDDEISLSGIEQNSR